MVANLVDLERNDFLMEFMGSKEYFFYQHSRKGSRRGWRGEIALVFETNKYFWTFDVHLKQNGAKGIQLKSWMKTYVFVVMIYQSHNTKIRICLFFFTRERRFHCLFCSSIIVLLFRSNRSSFCRSRLWERWMTITKTIPAFIQTMHAESFHRRTWIATPQGINFFFPDA